MGRKLSLFTPIIFGISFCIDVFIVIVYHDQLWAIKALFDGVATILTITKIEKKEST